MYKKIVFPALMILGFFSTLWLSCDGHESSEEISQYTFEIGDRQPARTCSQMSSWKARSVASGIITGCPGDGRTSTRRHAGIDIAGKYGSAIKAMASGVVTHKGGKGGYGSTVIINHNNGKCSLYAHLSKYGNIVGGRVRTGQTIGYMGNSGAVRRRKGGNGTHLHYEVYSCKKIGRATVSTQGQARPQQSKKCINVRSEGGLVCDSVPWFSGCKKIREGRYKDKYKCTKGNPWVRSNNRDDQSNGSNR